MTLRVQPDVEQLVVDYLLAHSELPAGLKVSTDIPAVNPEYPRVQIQRMGGGSRDREHLDGALIQVDVYGALGERKEAATLAGKVRAALAHDQIVGAHTLGVCTGALEQRGPQVLPSADKGRPRFSWDLTVWVHPNPP